MMQRVELVDVGLRYSFSALSVEPMNDAQQGLCSSGCRSSFSALSVEPMNDA